MGTNRIAKALGGILAVVVLTGTTAAQAAQASPAGAVLTGADAGLVAGRLGADRTGGAYLDDAGRAVVTVTDAAGARTVRAAGGVPRVVDHSLAELRAITAELDVSARVPGTSWGVDPRTNQVSVEVDSTVTGAELARVREAAGRFGAAVRVERITGTLTRTAAFTSGGQGIQDDVQSLRCSLGFNVKNSAGARFFVTAGHCGNKNSAWYKGSDGTFLGRNRESHFPGDDYAIVAYDRSDFLAYGTVWVDGTEQQITTSRYPIAGEPAARVGTASSDLVGTVLLTSTTVTYDDGTTVRGLIKTTHCTMFGDSGGALFNGAVALGITSGGTNAATPCSSPINNRRSYFQPVQEALDKGGLSVF